MEQSSKVEMKASWDEMDYIPECIKRIKKIEKFLSKKYQEEWDSYER